MWHTFPVLIIDTTLIDHYFSICFSLNATVAKHCTRLGKPVNFVGQPAVDAVYGMEKSSLEPALGVFNEWEGLMPDRLSGIVLYMFGNKSTILGTKREIKIAQTEQCWSRHVLHPDAVIEGFVYPSTGMLLCCSFGLVLFLHVCSDSSSKLDYIL